MPTETLTLKIGTTDIDKNPQPEEKLTKQELSLVNPKGKKLAVVVLYMTKDNESGEKGGFYSFYWHTNLPMDQLVTLTEECLAYYENNYEKASRTPGNNKNESPFMKSEPSDDEEKGEEEVYKKGTIIYFRKEDSKTGNRETFGLPPRPFNLDQIAQQVNNNEITFLRLNTAVGDFCIHPTFAMDKIGNFGILSDIRQTEGLSDLLVKSSSTPVDKQDAEKLITEATKILAEFETPVQNSPDS